MKDNNIQLNIKPYRNNRSMPLTDVLRSMTSNVKRKLYSDREILYKLEDCWKQIVGADICNYCMPSDIIAYKETSLKGPIEIRRLDIKCFNSDVTKQMTHRIGFILDTIKDTLGYRAFNKIKILNSYSERPQIEAKNIYFPIQEKKIESDILKDISEVQDDGIRQALFDLASSTRINIKRDS